MNEIVIPKIDVSPNNYRKHSKYNAHDISIDEEGHRLIPNNNKSNKKLYIFGGSVGFGYRLKDNETFSYHLKNLSGYHVINLSKICNDVMNLYYMVLSENPSDSVVVLDTGVYAEFQTTYYKTECMFNLNFSPNYTKSVFSQIIKYLLKRNNKVIAFSFCNECPIEVGIPIRYEGDDLIQEEGNVSEHPSVIGSIHLACDLFYLIRENKFISSYNERIDENEFYLAQDRNRQCNFLLLRKSKEYNRFINSLSKYKLSNTSNGIIFLSANPLTKGHEYLIKYALERVDHLYLYSTKNKALYIDAFYRHKMLDKIADVYDGKITVLPTCPLKNSSITFAPYLQKELFKDRKVSFVNEHITTFEMMEILNVSVRFFGEEPNDRITKVYMEEFIEMCEKRGKNVHVIPRMRIGDSLVSASLCREYISCNNEEYKRFVPECCVPIIEEFIKSIEEKSC